MHRFTKLNHFIAQAKCLARDESGATAIEYALIASCISIAIVAAVNSLGSTLNDFFFVKVVTAMK